MTLVPPLVEPRPFEPGTTGWTAADLDDPAIEREWFLGRYEIVEGVLTKMPAAYFAGGECAINLIVLVKNHVRGLGIKGGFSQEVDIVVDEVRVARADAVYLTPEQKQAQRRAALAAGRRDVKRTRILVPPTLIIESISPGHERHDEQTKRRWYAEFGVPSYWIINVFTKTLRCLTLNGNVYREEVVGGEDGAIRVAAFPGLVISMPDVWEE